MYRHASYACPAPDAGLEGFGERPSSGLAASGGTFSLPLMTTSGSNAPVSLRTSLIVLSRA
ncbi:hypothetical protein V5P93_004916 [Actinokineospora auranticolor]|uniref:hypothetical protein n=1 Tax=Actinokineospora auranticolor TaxID=155976 RepID=UPI000CEBF329|nr:hypothetical protein [Actinokineospora auranticolor]